MVGGSDLPLLIKRNRGKLNLQQLFAQGGFPKTLYESLAVGITILISVATDNVFIVKQPIVAPCNL